MKGQISALIALYILLFPLRLYYTRYYLLSIQETQTLPQKRLKVFMYHLPPKFNSDLVGKYANISPSIKSESGIGIPLSISEFVFDTNQYALEQYFYYRLRHSSYLTTNASDADLLYIPFFSNLVKMTERYHLYQEVWEYLEENYDFSLSIPTLHKHFVVFGGVMKWAQRFVSSPYVEKINCVVLERNEWKNQTSSLIVAPYPGQVHFYQNRTDKIDFSKKTLLASSAWNSRYYLRQVIRDLCTNQTNKNVCKHVELRSNVDIYDHKMVYEMTARSVFCFSPHGDSSTRKAFYDALLVGCINVVYDNHIKLPFDDKINYENLTVYIPRARVNESLEILQKIPKEQIEAKQQYINKNRIHFQYTIMKSKDRPTLLPFYKKDAFNLLIDEIYKQSLQNVTK